MDDDLFCEANKEFLEDRNSPVPNCSTALGGVLKSTHTHSMTPRPTDTNQMFDSPSGDSGPYVKSFEESQQSQMEQDVANCHVSTTITGDAERETETDAEADPESQVETVASE